MYRRILAAAVLVPIAAQPALANHAKPGLWRVTTTIDMSNGQTLSPAQMARMKAAGVKMPTSNTFTAEHCVTPREAAMNVPPAAQRHNGCTMNGFKLAGNTMTAKMMCTGDVQANGRMIVTYRSSTHYTGELTLSGTSHGNPVTLTNRFEGKWIAADCGGIDH